MNRILITPTIIDTDQLLLDAAQRVRDGYGDDSKRAIDDNQGRDYASVRYEMTEDADDEGGELEVAMITDLRFVPDVEDQFGELPFREPMRSNRLPWG